MIAVDLNVKNLTNDTKTALTPIIADQRQYKDFRRPIIEILTDLATPYPKALLKALAGHLNRFLSPNDFTYNSTHDLTH